MITIIIIIIILIIIIIIITITIKTIIAIITMAILIIIMATYRTDTCHRQIPHYRYNGNQKLRRDICHSDRDCRHMHHRLENIIT